MPNAFAKDFMSHAVSLGEQGTIVDGPIEIIPGVYSTGPMGDDNLPEERRYQSLVLGTAEGTVVLTGVYLDDNEEIAKRGETLW